MRNYYLIIILGLLVAPIFSKSVKESSPAFSISYIEDLDSKLRLADVLAFTNDRFIRVNGDLSLSFSESTFWIKIDTSSLSKDKSYVITIPFPPLDQLEFFYFRNSGYQSRIAGDSVIEEDSDLFHRYFAFRYIPESDKPVYFRLKTNSSVYFPVKINEESEFIDNVYFEQFFLGIYFGIIAVMILYNLFLYLNLREKNYLYYVVYVLSLMIYLAVELGYAKIFFWQNNIFLNNIMNPLSASVAVITGILMIINFLELGRYRIQSRLYYFLIFLLLVSIVGIFTFKMKLVLYFLNSVVLLTVLLMFYSIFYEIGKRNKMGWYFLIAYGGFLSIIIYTVIANLGFVKQSFASTYGLTFSSAFEVTIISLALAYKINVLRKQKEYFEGESASTRKRYNLLKNEVEVAAKIQASILPESCPTVAKMKIEAVYQPHGNVGGDFYDFIKISESQIGVLVADVTGHGIPAALLASMANFSFSYEKDYATDTVEVLRRMNRSLYNKMGNHFVTAIYTYIDISKMTLDYSSCGHPPLVLFRKETGEVITGKPKGKMMGVFENIIVERLTISLMPGDRVIIFTDGVFESMGFVQGLEKLTDFIKETREKTIEEVKNLLLGEIKSGKHQNDDSTFVLLDII